MFCQGKRWIFDQREVSRMRPGRPRLDRQEPACGRQACFWLAGLPLAW
jgi:hypothetical protein